MSIAILSVNLYANKQQQEEEIKVLLKNFVKSFTEINKAETLKCIHKTASYTRHGKTTVFYDLIAKRLDKMLKRKKEEEIEASVRMKPYINYVNKQIDIFSKQIAANSPQKKELEIVLKRFKEQKKAIETNEFKHVSFDINIKNIDITKNEAVVESITNITIFGSEHFVKEKIFWYARYYKKQWLLTNMIPSRLEKQENIGIFIQKILDQLFSVFEKKDFVRFMKIVNQLKPGIFKKDFDFSKVTDNKKQTEILKKFGLQELSAFFKKDSNVKIDSIGQHVSEDNTRSTILIHFKKLGNTTILESKIIFSNDNIKLEH